MKEEVNVNKTVRKAFAIEWDVDEGDCLEPLPKAVFIPELVADDDIADYLSKQYGSRFRVRSYSIEEVDLPFNLSSPFPWSNCRISDEKLEKILEMESDEKISVRETFFKAFVSDEEDEFIRLIEDYQHADSTTRSIIDATLVRICGWSLPSLCEMAEGKASPKTVTA